MESLGIIGFVFGLGALSMVIQLKTTVETLRKDVEELNSGEIGFIITGIKNLSETKNDNLEKMIEANNCKSINDGIGKEI